MPRSSSRYSRTAIRAKYRKPKRRRAGGSTWNLAIALVVLLGAGGIFLAVQDNRSAAGLAPLAPDPTNNVPGDHWHTFLGVNICGLWIPAAPSFEKAHDNPNGSNVGIHSHGDGLIHTHPFVPSEEGVHATIGKFFGYGGWSLGSDFIDAWSGPITKVTKTRWTNGDQCPVGDYQGKKGMIAWSVDGKTMSGNPADYHQKDGQIVIIAFLPKGAPIPMSPDACSALENIGDINGGSSVDARSPCLSQPPATAAPGTSGP
jgi:hypothetical protein